MSLSDQYVNFCQLIVIKAINFKERDELILVLMEWFFIRNVNVNGVKSKLSFDGIEINYTKI